MNRVGRANRPGHGDIADIGDGQVLGQRVGDTVDFALADAKDEYVRSGGGDRGVDVVVDDNVVVDFHVGAGDVWRGRRHVQRMARAHDDNRAGVDRQRLHLHRAAGTRCTQADGIVEAGIGGLEGVAAVVAADDHLPESVLQVLHFLGFQAELVRGLDLNLRRLGVVGGGVGEGDA